MKRHLAIPLRNNACRCGEEVHDARFHFTMQEYDRMVDNNNLTTVRSMSGTEWEVARGTKNF